MKGQRRQWHHHSMLLYGIDKNFLFGCGVSITSVLLHNNDVSFVFHVFIDDIPEADIQRLAQLAKSYHTCIQIHLVNCERLKALPTTKNWSIAMYFRFVIADYFIDQQDKILYLDADIACQGNLKPLITMDLANNVAAVVTDAMLTGGRYGLKVCSVMNLKRVTLIQVSC